MTLRYSASHGFQDTELHADIPADAVSVTPARHAKLMAAQAEGAAIVPSPDTRKPIIQRPHQDATARRAAVTRAIKREAARRIAEISPEWRQLNDVREPSEAGAARFARIDAVRAASDAIDAVLAGAVVGAIDAFPVRDNPLWAQFEDTI